MKIQTGFNFLTWSGFGQHGRHSLLAVAPSAVAKGRPIAGADIRIQAGASSGDDKGAAPLAIAEGLHHENGIAALDRLRQRDLRPAAGADLLGGAAVDREDR